MFTASILPCTKQHLGSIKYFYRSRSTFSVNAIVAQKTLCSAPIRFSRRPVDKIHNTDSKFPFADSFGLSSGDTYSSAQIIAGLQPLVTDQRLDTINKVINGRCFSILPVVEGLHDMGNLGAVCRSADALGLGAVHCINADGQRYRARKKRQSAGAEKWMDVRMWDSASACIADAKAAGFRVVATHMNAASVGMHEVDWSQPTAIILGNERDGVSTKALEMADATAYIPMSGFVTSFNVSVAASLILYEARRARMQQLDTHGNLSSEEKEILKAVMLLRHQGQTTEHIQQLLEREQAGSLTAASVLHRHTGTFK